MNLCYLCIWCSKDVYIMSILTLYEPNNIFKTLIETGAISKYGSHIIIIILNYFLYEIFRGKRYNYDKVSKLMWFCCCCCCFFFYINISGIPHDEYYICKNWKKLTEPIFQTTTSSGLLNQLSNHCKLIYRFIITRLTYTVKFVYKVRCFS